MARGVLTSKGDHRLRRGKRLDVYRWRYAVVGAFLIVYLRLVWISVEYCFRLDSILKKSPPLRLASREEKSILTIGFAVTITGCGADPPFDGAAVLQHSIHLASMHGDMGGRYDYKMYALYHPDAEHCTLPLASLGYELLKRDVFVQVQDIQGEFLRTHIQENGCCGEKELIKLEAYTLTQHPIIVLLDLDVIVLKPLDALFDWMLNGVANTDLLSRTTRQWPNATIPDKVNAFFTRDYNVVAPRRHYKPVQGGFLVLRPDMAVYNEFRSIVLKGNYHKTHGWGMQHIGPFHGGLTVQGLLPYYYDYLHPGQVVELNHCVYNQMGDNPRTELAIDNVAQGKCRTNENDCEDCRARPMEDVVTAHFTICQKPWMCHPMSEDNIDHWLCRKLHHQWHRIRADLERSWGRNATGSGEWQTEHFYGHCNHFGRKGYRWIVQPRMQYTEYAIESGGS